MIMKILLRMCCLLLSFICFVDICAAERPIKKAKIDDAVTALCECFICSSMRADAVEHDNQDFVIAQALLPTGLNGDVIDIVYDYVNYSMYPHKRLCDLSDSRLSGRKDGQTASCLSFVSRAIELSPFLRMPGSDAIIIMHPFHIPEKAIHILPQEVAFDVSALNEGCEIAYGSRGDRSQSLTIRSLCTRYVLNFKFQEVVMFPSTQRLSQSPGWQRAIAELKSKE